MAYKDKDKQREADRARQRRYRAERGLKAYPKGVTGRDTKGVTSQGSTKGVTDLAQGPNPYGPQFNGKACEYPKTTRVPTHKRGKDIKCFADLPTDVQETIDKMSDTKEEKQKRTAAAIKYQHIFPDRYHTGLAAVINEGSIITGKPGDADYNGICTEAWRAERGR